MSALLKWLEHIRTRPGMYFGAGERSSSILFLQAFITGFNCGQVAPGDTGDLQFFTEWVAIHYHMLAEGRDGFRMILEHAEGDERNAFDEFFRLLPDFLRDKQEMGRDGILSRFTIVQDEAFEAFQKELEKE